MKVTILIPVYRGLGDVRACVESAVADLRGSEIDGRILIIDDCSPDDEVREYLGGLAVGIDGVPIAVAHNPENLGFVATINRGMELAGDSDVIWLNSDTIVAPNAFASMVSTAASDPDIATVTPLTTFGSICTLPTDLLDALGPIGDVGDVQRVGEFIRTHSPGLRPSVISGVGFCMFVRRAAWELVGPLDVRAFGAGYGEEVDFCLRASRAGFSHRVADDAFVHHAGGGSFGTDQRRERLKASSKVLHDRYPHFRAANAAERSADPLAPTFAALRAGLMPRDPARPHVLQIIHSEPGALGGTESHSEILWSAMAEGLDFSVCYPVPAGVVLQTRWRQDDGTIARHEFLIPAAARRSVEPRDPNIAIALRTVLDLFDFDAVHIQNLVGYSVEALIAFDGFPGPVILSLRDLYLVCPHHWLMYRNEANCGVPTDLDVCATCLPLTRDMPIEALVEHREVVQRSMAVVDRLVVATANSLDYLTRAYDVAPEQVAVIEHGAIVDLATRRAEVNEDLVLQEPLRLAFVGLARKKKGIDIASWLAAELVSDGIEMHAFGAENEEIGPHVVVHGAYDNEALPLLLDAAGIQACLLVAPYAETFGHTMTESLLAGCPVIVSEFGALAERVRRDGVGWIVDPADLDSIAELVRRLDRDRMELLHAATAVADLSIKHTEETAASYAALYGAPFTESRERSTMHTEQEERQRRALQAMALVNRQLQTSATASVGASPAELREVRRTLRSREREIARLNEAFAAARKGKRAAERDLAALRNRKSVRLALRLARLFAR